MSIYHYKFQNGLGVRAEPGRVAFDNKLGTITLDNLCAEPTDPGKYNLVMRNELGFDTVSFNVKVVGKNRNPFLIYLFGMTMEKFSFVSAWFVKYDRQ